MECLFKMADPLSKAIENTKYWQDRCFKAEADNKRLREVLADITEKGHKGGYHGKGYTLATLAHKALLEEDL